MAQVQTNSTPTLNASTAPAHMAQVKTTSIILAQVYAPRRANRSAAINGKLEPKVSRATWNLRSAVIQRHALAYRRSRAPTPTTTPLLLRTYLNATPLPPRTYITDSANPTGRLTRTDGPYADIGRTLCGTPYANHRSLRLCTSLVLLILRNTAPTEPVHLSTNATTALPPNHNITTNTSRSARNAMPHLSAAAQKKK